MSMTVDLTPAPAADPNAELPVQGGTRTGLPADLWMRITAFIPHDGPRSRMKETCFTMCNLLSRQDLKRLKQEPIISWLIPETPPIDKRTDCRQILSALARVIECGNKLDNHSPSDDVFDCIDSLRSRQVPIQLSILRELQLYGSHYVEARLLTNDDILQKPDMTKFQDSEEMDCFMAILRFCEGNYKEFVPCFRKLYLYEDDLDASKWLCSAAKKNFEDIFTFLLTQPWDSPGEIIMEFISNKKISPSCITRVLQSRQDLNSSSPGHSYADWGIEDALIYAVKQNNMPAFEAILAARPGDAITRQVLVDVKCLIADSQLAMIACIDREIATRYPRSDSEVIAEALAEIPLDEISDDDDAEPAEGGALLPFAPGPSDFLDTPCSLM